MRGSDRNDRARHLKSCADSVLDTSASLLSKTAEEEAPAAQADDPLSPHCCSSTMESGWAVEFVRASPMPGLAMLLC